MSIDALGDLGLSGNHDGVLYVLSRMQSIEVLLFCVHSLHSGGGNRVV